MKTTTCQKCGHTYPEPFADIFDEPSRCPRCEPYLPGTADGPSEDELAAMECEQSVIRHAEKRYYVYIGPACSEWVDYADAEEARTNHPGEWAFDRVTKKPVEFKEA